MKAPLETTERFLPLKKALEAVGISTRHMTKGEMIAKTIELLTVQVMVGTADLESRVKLLEYEAGLR